MKPTIFIGSSTEGKEIAYAMQEELDSDAIVTVWSQGVFQLSNNTIDDLLEIIDKSDFGVFIFSPDDLVKIRNIEFSTVRDNVVLELGMFIGGIGKSRSFIVQPEENNGIRLPTDLLGVTTATYNAHRSDENSQAALGPACNKIRRAITKLGVRKKFLSTPNTDQPEDWHYHFRIQRLVTATSKKDDPEFAFNLSKSSFDKVAIKLYNGQNVNIAGVTTTGIEINTGVVGLVVLRSKDRADVESNDLTYPENREYFWNKFRYRGDVIDITAELEISNYYAS